MNDETFWLPETRSVKLTDLELGILLNILVQAKKAGLGAGLMRKPGPDGTVVSVSMIDRLIEKAIRCATD